MRIIVKYRRDVYTKKQWCDETVTPLLFVVLLIRFYELIQKCGGIHA